MVAPGTSTPRPLAHRRRWWLAGGAVVALLLAALVLWLLRPTEPPPAAAPAPAATPTPAPTPTPTVDADPCADQAGGPITPTHITFPGIARDLTVVALPRDANNVPSLPATSAKRQVAWDRPPGIKPGAARGNVLMNAHTWPDGTALGNLLLADLRVGDRILVRGDEGLLCYEVDRQVEVRAVDRYPEYYDREGPPQLAFLVCSGKRLGPRNWTHRTIWFATPV